MRVLHAYSGNLFGGVEAILVAVARNQSRLQGVTHEFALAFHGRLERELLNAGACVHHLAPVRVSRPTSIRTARSRLTRLLESIAVDRVICHAPWSLGIFGGVVRRTGTPLVFWAHDVMTGRHWTERLARRVAPDFAICNSRFTAGTLAMLYPVVPSTVIYAPVETARALTDSSSRRQLRALLGTPQQSVVIAQASRSEPWKGHAVLVEALARLRELPDWVWWQIGGAQRPAENAFLASIKQSVDRYGLTDRVRWIGERDDVPALLAAADVYCQPNIEPEPFGVVFVEALAAGLPVVTSRAGGAPEIVDRSCGVLVEPGDSEGLAAVLRRLVEDQSYRTQLSAAAPARARALCNPSTQLQQLTQVLHRLAPAEVGA